MSWIDSALDHLRAARLPAGGWSYQPQDAPAAEPTALASLARAAHGRGDPADSAWLTSIQRDDGAVPIDAELEGPAWPTALALLAWIAAGAAPAAQERAAAFLLDWQGRHWPPRRDRESGVGHDTSIPGWPWVDATHSWVEPTGYAVCALRRAGRGEHPRVEAGLRLILDRSVDGGGWNYGNSAVLGNRLRAFPGPSGVALVALAPRCGADERVQQAVSYLRARLPAIRSPVSLGWGLLGLSACGAAPPEGEAWLAESWERRARRGPGSSVETSVLLLAAGGAASCALFGATG